MKNSAPLGNPVKRFKDGVFLEYVELVCYDDATANIKTQNGEVLVVARNEVASMTTDEELAYQKQKLT